MPKPNEVFTPAARPNYTYIDRAHLELETKLLNAINTTGQLVSVTGPSKSGKTVLCETVVGKQGLFLITGGGIKTETDFWNRIRAKLAMPVEVSSASERTQSSKFEAKGEAGIDVPLLGAAKAGISGELGTENARTVTTTSRNEDGVQLLSYLKLQGVTLVIDDFHYIPAAVRMSLAQQFKEGARDGLPIVAISVTHRADDAIKANPDLRGRVSNVEIPYWEKTELRLIAKLGFPKLNLEPDAGVIERMVIESVRSPQLMQALCLQFCRQVGCTGTYKEVSKPTLTGKELGLLLRDTSALTNCRSAYEILVTGPRVRGQDRKEYTFAKGGKGDVYEVILRALAVGEPALTIGYESLKERVAQVCTDETPRGVSITEALDQMNKAIGEKLADDRVLDWNDNYINIPDPYFLYYLRWADLPKLG